MLMDKNDICGLLPHSGNMCLLDKVVSWDKERIHCCALSHTDPDNPLRRDGHLSTINLIEYGAQAMGVHGALLALQEDRQVESGFLLTLSEIHLDTGHLSETDAPLEIRANLIATVSGVSRYRFVTCIKDREMASGCATVLMNTRKSK